MDGQSFDRLTRAVLAASSRRGALRLLTAALAAGLSRIDLVAALAERANTSKKKKKGGGNGCRKLNQSCNAKNRCCKGKKLTCKKDTCRCKAGTVPKNGKCVPAPQPECENDDDCGANEICQNGECVPEPPECVEDNDCDANEVCQNGTCVPDVECVNANDCPGNDICVEGECIACLDQFDDRCVLQCQGSSDCPGSCSCRGVFPGAGNRVACVNEPFLLCDAPSCNSSDDCSNSEVCAFTTCDSPAGSGRCFPICIA